MMKTLLVYISLAIGIVFMVSCNNNISTTTKQSDKAPINSLLDSLIDEYPTSFGNPVAKNEFALALESKLSSYKGKHNPYTENLVFICHYIGESDLKTQLMCLSYIKTSKGICTVHIPIGTQLDKSSILKMELHKPYLISGVIDSLHYCNQNGYGPTNKVIEEVSNIHDTLYIRFNNISISSPIIEPIASEGVKNYPNFSKTLYYK